MKNHKIPDGRTASNPNRATGTKSLFSKDEYYQKNQIINVRTYGILRGALGWTLFGVIWGLAITGVVLKAFYKTAHPILSTCLYLLMGWLLVIAVKPLSASMPSTGLILLIAGGLS